MNRSSIIVGLDIGTTKVCAIVGELHPEGIKIIGIGTHPSRGLRKGVVNNIESTCASIEKAVEEAEIHSDCEINSVFVGITGWQIKSMMSHGVAALKENAVGKKDVDRVMEAASAVVIPKDRQVIHVLPCEYIVDGKARKRPIGKTGVRFEVNCHVVTSARASVENLCECCRQTGLYVENVIFEPLASAMAVLSDDERTNGVAMIDIGGGTSDMVIVRNGAVVHSAVIPLGGNHLTNDISQVLKIPPKPTAELLKQRYSAALSSLILEDQEIEVEVPGLREVRFVSQRILAEITENRMEEMFRLIHSEMESSGFADEAQTGIVLTGGTTLLAGTEKLAEEVFRMPSRIGLPKGVFGKENVIGNPQFSTAVGLLLYGAKQVEKSGQGYTGERTGLDQMLVRVKKWIANLI